MKQVFGIRLVQVDFTYKHKEQFCVLKLLLANELLLERI